MRGRVSTTQSLLALALVAVAGCAAEPAWQEGQLGEIHEGLSVGGVSGCSTFAVDGLSQQLIAEQNCIRANALVSFAGKPGISIGANVYPYLEPTAAQGLEAAAAGTTLDVTSAFRTVAQQYLLYSWYQSGQCGISLAAVPGNSNHETGIAVDLGNYDAAIGAMSAHGWTHSYPSSDPVHFDFTGGGTADLRAESVLAFQRLWNLNNPGDKIGEDGAYGSATGTRIAAAPATGFAKGATCSGTPTPPTTPPPPPSLAAQFVGQSVPARLLPGESASAWVEFKNIGTTTWTRSATHLGTAEPRDRASVLVAADWLGPNRPSDVDADTKPGDVGRFSFFVHGPSMNQTTVLTEHFELVEEGVAWFGPEATFAVEIEPTPGAAPPADGGSGDVPADGIAPTPGAHHGCAVAGWGAQDDGAATIASFAAVVALTLFRRRRASYSSGRCIAPVESFSSSSSRSRS